MTEKDSKSDLGHRIDENLRKVYQRTLEEDVPDQLMSILQKLREQDAQDDK